MDLGAPISGGGTGGQIGKRNTVPSDGFDQGEHGAGIGLSGGADTSTAQNTQSGSMAGEREMDQYGSSGNKGDYSTPIADRFMGQNGGTGGRDNSLDQYGSSGDSTTGYGSAGTVSGAYEGGGSGDALTGQSGLSQTPTKPSELICLGPGHAQRTGAGVGPLGENLGSGGQGAGRAGVGGALGGAAAGEYASLGDQAGVTRGPGAQRTVAGDGEVAGQSREPLGGTTGGLVGGLGGTSGNYSSGQNYSSTNAGLGAGAAAGGAGHGSSGGNDRGDNNNSGADSGGRTGHYGKVSDDSNRGAPISDPKEVDTGGPHSLVFQESTGRYVHRRDL